MEFIHEIPPEDNTQINYGLIRWKKRDAHRYRKIFPSGTFTVIMFGKTLHNRHVDWDKNRIYFSKKIMTDNLKPGDKLIIKRVSDTTVIIKKADPTARDRAESFKFYTILRKIRCLEKLENNQEKIGIIKSALLLLDLNIHESLSYLTVEQRGMRAAIVPDGSNIDYAEDMDMIATVSKTSGDTSCICIYPEALCRIIENHHKCPYTPGFLFNILFMRKKELKPEDVITQEHYINNLIALNSAVLSDLIKTGRNSFTLHELITVLRWKNLLEELGIEEDEVSHYINVFTEPPVILYRRDGDNYKLSSSNRDLLIWFDIAKNLYSRIGRGM